MADRRIEGKVIFTDTKAGIKDLEIVAFDLDPFFLEDRLGSSKTNGNGEFSISYSHSPYNDWIPGRNPDIVVRVYTPGGRLLYERAEVSNVAATVLTVGTIELHPKNVNGWLVTNATLDPVNPRFHQNTTIPVTWTTGNRIEILKDGETMFPAVTQAVEQAKDSVRFINMNFWLGKNLITEFPAINDPTHPFDPLNPVIGQPVVGKRFHEVLLARATDRNTPLQSANVLVQDVPFIDQIPVISRLLNPDTADEVNEFFQGSPVEVRLMSILNHSNVPTFMHSKAVVIDGVTAFVLGSTFTRSYFGAEEHLINDARHGENLIHDVSVKIQGPAVEHVDRAVTTLWNAGDGSGSALQPATTHQTQGALGLQIVRTLPGGVFDSAHAGGIGIPHGETGALEAYQRAIANAKQFVYLEDQYFTAPEIFQALHRRMLEEMALEVIIVMNSKPDVKGYPEKQIQLLKQFQKDLVSEVEKKMGITSDRAEEQVKRRLGIYTIWSCKEKEPKYEIMPIYVHSKVAVVDDVWATIGSANLDGASLNQCELQTVVEGAVSSIMDKGSLWKRILCNVIAASAWQLVRLVMMVTGIGLSRPTQHANPQQSRQPTRSSELNVVICEESPDPLIPNGAVESFREALWQEHLGLGSPPVSVEGWVKIWNTRADEKLQNVLDDAKKPVASRHKHPAKVLRWVPKVEAKEYLEALGIKTANLRVRDKADSFDFEKGQWDK